MKLSIITKKGDTFERISRRVFGTETQAGRIAHANPQAKEPLSEGTILTIPNTDLEGNDVPLSTSNLDEVVVEIDRKRFMYWNEIRINRSMDRFDTVSFSSPFDSENIDFRRAFVPLSFKSLRVSVGGQLLFNGTMLDIVPTVEPGVVTVSVAGYSKPGVLNDCTPPATMFNAAENKLEFKNRTLMEIAIALCDPFGIRVESMIDFVKTVSSINPPITDEIQGFPLATTASAPTEEGRPFAQVSIEPTNTIYDFLVKLARRRRLLLANNERGSLVICRSSGVGKPVARLRQGERPLVAITPSFNPQEYFSHITALSPVAVGTEGAKATVYNDVYLRWRKKYPDDLVVIRKPKLVNKNDADNPLSENVLRPYVFGMDDSDSVDDGSEKESAQTKMGRMFANCVSYTVQIATWRDPQGALWKPNTTIIIEYPDAMIYRPFEFLIRGVEFNAVGNARTATLTLVIPGGFDGVIPKVLPWD